MTISSTTTSQIFTCNGVANTYAVTYAFLTASEIDVYHLAASTGVITKLTLTTNYTVSGTTDSNGHYTSGATVTTVTTYPSGDKITVERVSARTQTADYSVAGKFPAEQHEGALDKLTFLMQEIWSRLAKTLSVAYGSTFTGTTTLNVDEASGGDVLRLNAGKTAFELTDPVNASLTTALTPTDGNFIVGNGSAFVTESGATARASLGLTIGTDVQAYDAELAAIAGLTSAADKLPYFDGAGSAAVADFSAFARTLVDDANASAARTTLGLVIGTDVQAQDATLQDLADLSLSANDMIYSTGSGLTTTTISSFGRSLVDDNNASTARTTLGLTIGTDVQAYDAGLQSISGLTTAADKMIYTTASDTYAVTDLSAFARTLLDDADAATARATLGVGAGTGDVVAPVTTTQYKIPYWDSVADTLVDGVAPGTSGNVLTSNGTQWTSATPTTVSAASQAEQEAGTEAGKFVAPATQHYHPSALKAWAFVAVSGGTPSISASYNFTSITDNGVGLYTLTYTNNLSSANYAAVASGDPSSASLANVSTGVVARTVSTVQVQHEISNGSTTDRDFDILVAGDL